MSIPSRPKRAKPLMFWLKPAVAIGLCLFISGMSSSVLADVLGPKKVVALRVYFQDYPDESRFDTAEFQSMTDGINQLWQDTSYSKSSMEWQVTAQFQLPDDRDEYIEDIDSGDLSTGSKYMKVLRDAVANSPAGIDWTDIDGVTVMMAETDANEFHRGQANACSLSMGPGGDTETVGCAIFSENPGENATGLWGRMAHEVGHMFQEGGPAHPSDYNSDFELMDANYPGQTGVFSKLPMMGFPGWLDHWRYLEFDSSEDGQTQCIVAMEYDLTGNPNFQAIKAEITDSLYYLISVRRQVLGDDLNATFNGIPDEGVLIERVDEGAEPWVGVKGKDGDREQLWQEGDSFSDAGDGIFIAVNKQDDADNYCVTVRYTQGSNQPDMAMYPWRQTPGNTYETTDIWNDSPVNGYNVFRYGMWNDLDGNLVPTGNGDDPAVGLENRLYARVRNWGSTTATDVVVNFEVTDPLGVGIAGSNGWAALGSVDENDFPALSSIAPGAYVDVYVIWEPQVELTAEQLDAGVFNFHSCVRVKIDPVAGEVALGNQDGKREQENISVFEASTIDAGEPYKNVIHLHNDDLQKKKYFYLSYDSELPDGWELDINGGEMGILLAPGEMRDIPVYIQPTYAAQLGAVHGVNINAASHRVLSNDKDPSDTHLELSILGGVRIEARGLLPSSLYCDAGGSNQIDVKGILKTGYGDLSDYAEQLAELSESRRHILPGVTIQAFDEKGKPVNDEGTSALLEMDEHGQFSGSLHSKRGEIHSVRCLFSGTELLASSASEIIKVR